MLTDLEQGVNVQAEAAARGVEVSVSTCNICEALMECNSLQASSVERSRVLEEAQVDQLIVYSEEVNIPL